MRPEVYTHPLGIFMVAALVALSVVVVTFPALYTRSNWRVNRVGRALMYLSLAHAVIVILTMVLLAVTAFTDYEPGPAVAFLRGVVYVGAAVTQALMIRTLWRIQTGQYPTDLQPDQSPERKALQ